MAKKSFTSGLNSLLKKTDKAVDEKKEEPKTKKTAPKKQVSSKPVAKTAQKPVAKKTTATKSKAPAKTIAKKPVTPKAKAEKTDATKAANKPAAAVKKIAGHTIKIPSSITIDNSYEFKVLLANESKGKQDITIQGNIENIDLTAVQELIAFDEKAQKDKVSVNYDIKLNEDMKQLLNNAGLFDSQYFK